LSGFYYIQHLKELADRGEIKHRKYHDRKLMIERYFEKFFDDTLIGEIKRPQIEAYREWRKNYWVYGEGSRLRRWIYERNGQIVKSPVPKTWKGRVPTTSTLNSEETALRAVFKFAVNSGYLSEGEVPVIRTEGITWRPRSTFSEKEYTKLLAIGRKRIKQALNDKREREAHQRFMVYQYVLIAANCGARVVELMNLRWKDITWEDRDIKGNASILLDVSGKSKYRTLVANDECRDYLNRIRQQMIRMAQKYGFKFDEKNGFVFTDYRGRKIGSFKKTFNAWLEEAGVIRDKDGYKRCLGSLRIFYATMRLLRSDNLDLYDLALQMGTSVQMLQKTYSRLTARLKAHKIKRSSFSPEANKKDEQRSTKIIETDSELNELSLNKVYENELDQETIEVASHAGSKVSD
jgi:integrase